MEHNGVDALHRSVRHASSQVQQAIPVTLKDQSCNRFRKANICEVMHPETSTYAHMHHARSLHGLSSPILTLNWRCSWTSHNCDIRKRDLDSP